MTFCNDDETEFFTHRVIEIDKNNQMSNKGILRLMQEVAGICSGSLGYGVNDVPKTEDGEIDYSKDFFEWDEEGFVASFKKWLKEKGD